RSAFRELEGPAGLRLAVLLALDHAAVAREEPDRFQHRTQPRLVIDQRAADAVTHRAGLARETAADHGAINVVLSRAVRHLEGLRDDHAQHRPREIHRRIPVVDNHLASPARQPDARDRVLALAGGVGAALSVELRLCRFGIFGGTGGSGGILAADTRAEKRLTELIHRL